MQITLKEIEEKALKYKTGNKNWHFHILTPGCIMNQSNEYVLVLENSTDDESFVYYSEDPITETTEKLVKLSQASRHPEKGEGTFENKPSTGIKPIIKKAKELSDQGKPWHYHLLSPDCIFNQDKPNWTIIFEDVANNEKAKILSIEEPKNDIKQIQTVFEGQKK